MRKNKIKNAQSTIEYAVILASIVLALLAMQVYIKRSFMGKQKLIADDLGQQYDPKNTTTIEPYTLSSTGKKITTVETLSEKGFYERCLDAGGNSEAYCRSTSDLNNDGLISDDVFGTETVSSVDADNPETIKQTGREHVGPLESSLF